MSKEINNFVPIRLRFLFDSKITGAWGSNPTNENAIRCIRAADFISHTIKHDEVIPTKRSYTFEEIEKKSLKEGDVIIEKSGGGENQPVGRVVLFKLDHSALCSNFLQILRPNKEQLYAKFGAYLLLSIWEQRAMIPAIKQTTGIQNLDIGAYLDIKVKIPLLPTQQKIAAYLDRETTRIDALIAAKERLITLLKEKRQALITRVVTKGLEANAPMKDSGVDWLGEVPVGWEVMNLKRLLSIIEYGISERVKAEGNIIVLRMGDIQNGEIKWTKVGYIQTDESVPMLRIGDLLFNRTNSFDKIGKVALFRGHQFPVSFASYLVRFRCNERIIPEFLNYFLNCSYKEAWSKSESLPAIGQVNLNPNRFAYLKIAVPPIAIQYQIVEYLNEKIKLNNSIIERTKSTIFLLKERRSSLISNAVTGQLEIPAS